MNSPRTRSRYSTCRSSSSTKRPAGVSVALSADPAIPAPTMMTSKDSTAPSLSPAEAAGRLSPEAGSEEWPSSVAVLIILSAGVQIGRGVGVDVPWLGQPLVVDETAHTDE